MIDFTTPGASIALVMGVVFLGWIVLLAACWLGVTIWEWWWRR